MGEGVWIDSEKLNYDDEVREVLKHGTLSVGFIGLAEALKALLGVHHGESEIAQNLGLDIIGHMRKRMDDLSAETHLNFSLLATPAEGCPAVLSAWTENASAPSRVSQTENITQTASIFLYITPSARIRRFSWKHLITS